MRWVVGEQQVKKYGKHLKKSLCQVFSRVSRSPEVGSAILHIYLLGP